MGNKITKGIRLTSMLVDHFAMTFISGIIMAVCIAIGGVAIFFFKFNVNLNSEFIVLVLCSLVFSTYLNKDAVNGQSVAKRILKNQVVNNKSGEIASPVRCLIRNVTIPIWIIEIPFVLINPQRRLGDLIAGTRVDSLNSELNPRSTLIDYIISLLLGGFYITIIGLTYFYAFRIFN